MSLYTNQLCCAVWHRWNTCNDEGDITYARAGERQHVPRRVRAHWRRRPLLHAGKATDEREARPPPDPRSTELRLPADIRAGIETHLCERTRTPGVLAKRAHLRELERPLLVW